MRKKSKSKIVLYIYIVMGLLTIPLVLPVMHMRLWNSKLPLSSLVTVFFSVYYHFEYHGVYAQTIPVNVFFSQNHCIETLVNIYYNLLLKNNYTTVFPDISLMNRPFIFL